MSYNYKILNATKEEEVLISEIISYIIEKYSESNISNLREINVVDKLEGGSTARCEKNRIILARNNGLNNIKNCTDIETDINSNDWLHMLVSSIYHELWHVNTWERYKEMYEYVSNSKSADVFTSFAYVYWIEYIAHIETIHMENQKVMMEFCENFVDKRWDRVEYGYSYFIKALPYYIVRAQYLNVFEQLTDRIISDELRHAVKNFSNTSHELLRAKKMTDIEKAKKIEAMIRELFKE